ncbi:putative Cyclophilin type peptidyl prolyl cis trans isomerase [Trypanosoma vivax]|uniref:Peptidyl-prolyl cis-trans isomerase n=1 Tax=Trypanosoma vivax (strain Y486) TaxID=1055687 RepID=F9WUB0_TRYVY|nr:putative cyclophilin-type peptidyl-prolyl cis-trans isomerase [Trypanosoma vivax]KAH8608861.1 putative Cyclophilin type peptidyl prolyl cis trans isomerase [Trypanosoma vivax]CCD21158.1 cyclophilin-type peptidyl-prolyl cis-trans isomerase, putative [Trypanosoma vivax Y486]|eukprot:CCD21158.1 cyclophilin-type peptidyl-prolyl cis-trans isomerase, putative [Trypanosoma vivax Y486]
MQGNKAEGGKQTQRVRQDSRLKRSEKDEGHLATNKRYQDVEERRLKEWENYQRSHRSTEEQQSSRAFLDMSIDDVLSGRLVLELFVDSVPQTVQNFRALITGSCGIDPATGVKLDYLGTKVHHVDHSKNMIVLGQLDSFNLSSTGGTIPDEKYRHRHTERGLLTMVSEGPNTSGSVFGITLGPSPQLDFKQVVFGRATDDLTLLEKLEAIPLDSVNRPVMPVVVTFCGALTGPRPSGKWIPPIVVDAHTASESDLESDESGLLTPLCDDAGTH